MRLYLRFRPNEDIDAWTYIFVHAGLNPWMITPSGHKPADQWTVNKFVEYTSAKFGRAVATTIKIAVH
jgi:hypothetical protein